MSFEQALINSTKIEKLLDSKSVKNQLRDRKKSAKNILDQLCLFKKGNIPLELISPAKVGDGIIKLNDNKVEELVNIYNKHLNDLNVVKFVPSSGAASRMFKDLLSEYSDYVNEKDAELRNYKHTTRLMENLERFAFFEDLKLLCDINDRKNFAEIVKKLLFDEGLNYSYLPKGLIKFHGDNNKGKTAFEEHLIEAKLYTKGKNNLCNIHFTVPQKAKFTIEQHLSLIRAKYEDNKTHYNITCSIQGPSTDTIAVDMNNEPITTEEGNLNFRPAGHGALIQNLNSIEADMIYIKNIDNVTVESHLEETVKYKKLLGGYLLSIKNKCHNFLKLIDLGKLGKEIFYGMEEFIQKHLSIDIQQSTDLNKKLSTYKELLNKPIRICGVVKNEDEPGGGPFWTKYGSYKRSLQIVESAQVDTSSKQQVDIWRSSTYFNPVDIVCWIKDYKGNKFNLNNYIDPNAVIITSKSSGNTEIKALELPGLWNGAMADWLTVFVEVPLITFNPVKNVFDLLRKNHQIKSTGT